MIAAVVERCLGIDVGKKFVVSCLMVGPAAEDPRVELKQLGTFTEDLLRLKAWITASSVRTRSWRALDRTGSQCSTCWRTRLR